jgi:hypothetical protein
MTSVVDSRFKTHNLALAGPIADFIVSVNADGVVSSRSQDLAVVLALGPDEPEVHPGPEKKPTEIVAKSGGKLIIAEEVQEGNVSWNSLRILLKAMGGNYAYVYFTLWFMGPISQYLLQSLSTWFLRDWSSQYERMPARDVPNVW